jgi:hypothetical protein
VMVLFVLLFGDPSKLGIGRKTDEEDHGGPEVVGEPLDLLGKNIPEGE